MSAELVVVLGTVLLIAMAVLLDSAPPAGQTGGAVPLGRAHRDGVGRPGPALGGH